MLPKYIYVAVGLIMSFYGCATLKETKLDKKWPQRLSVIDQFDIDPPLVKEGYILTKNNDTLKGYFKMRELNEFNMPSMPIPFLPFNKTKATDIINIKIDSINYIRKKLAKETDSVDYIPFESTLWLVLGRKNGIKILYQQWNKRADYDVSIYQQWDEIIIASDKLIVKIPTYGKKWSPHSQNFFILKFINERYGQNFYNKDFKNQKAMLDYILEKENEKLLN
jgi:hypothetical protein